LVPETALICSGLSTTACGVAGGLRWTDIGAMHEVATAQMARGRKYRVTMIGRFVRGEDCRNLLKVDPDTQAPDQAVSR
jgi:hypothetical protein